MPRKLFLLSAFFIFVQLSFAQQSTPDTAPQSTSSGQNQVEPMDHTPTYRVTVVTRTTEAVNYRKLSGSTTLDFKGTDLMPQANGKAKVDTERTGRLSIKTSLHHLDPPQNFGPEYLTYVLWAITPEGRPANLGEAVRDSDGNSSPQVTTELQAFGMIVTAEPYFAVTRPSNLVVLENIVRQDTEGLREPIGAKFDALDRGVYVIDISPSQLPASTASAKTPLDLKQAMNAVAIAKATGADRYAPDALAKAQDLLNRAELYVSQKQQPGPISSVSRGAVQQAEDARVLTIRKKEQEAVDAARQAQEQRTADAEAQAQREAQQRQQAEAAQQQAQQQQQQAEQARLAAEQARQQAEAASQQALQQQQAAQQQAEQSRLQAQQAEQQKEEMRTRLTQQLNQVLQTRDTARGLVATMPDVLFDSGKATLKTNAQIRLAKVAGILLAYPDLKLHIEGNTDNIGSDEYNQLLSERRAAAVRDFLISQKVPIDNIIAQGYGKSNPVAPNTTAQGRQLNRRVDLVVTGNAIGTATTTAPPAQQPSSRDTNPPPPQ